MATETLARQSAVARPATPRVALLTIGCKLNQAESEALAAELADAGCRVTDRAEAADLYIINTCAVTHVAERKARHLVRLARRLSPQARILVTGCYAETAAADVIAGLGADIVLPNQEKGRAAALILQAAGWERSDPTPQPMTRLRTRAFVKIQQGCSDVCAFCVVPRIRGPEQSLPAAAILRAIQPLEAEGVQEVVLTGTQLGAYGRDRPGGEDLVTLLRRLLKETAIPRLRLSSLQPQDITPALLDLWQDRRLCPHFHIALQSGSDSVLARMRRRYTTHEFRDALAAVRSRLPNVAITTDLLVGFPGETEEDYLASERFCREAAFAAVHVFPFSARPGTLAARLPGQVAAPLKRERVQTALALAAELRGRFLDRFQGEVMTVLCETSTRDKQGGGPVWEALTGNYIRVLVPSDLPLENRLVSVRLRERSAEGYWGEIVQPDQSGGQG